MTCYKHYFCGDSLISSSLKFQSIPSFHGVKIHSTQLIGAILYHRDLNTQHTAIGDTYTLTGVCSGARVCFIYSRALYGPSRLHHYYVQDAVRWEEKPTRGGTVTHSAQQPLLSAVIGMDAPSRSRCHHPWSCRKLCLTCFTSGMHSLCARAAGMLTWRFVPVTGSFPQTEHLRLPCRQ